MNCLRMDGQTDGRMYNTNDEPSVGHAGRIKKRENAIKTKESVYMHVLEFHVIWMDYRN